MIIGTPKEVKENEYRVGIMPSGVEELRKNGHTIYVERGAGIGSGIQDEAYEKAGAILGDVDTVYEKADMIVKVKELFPQEFGYLNPSKIIFTYIHSNAYREQTDALLNSKAIGIAYEDITDTRGEFPLLRPMSEIAGKGGFIAACNYMQRIHGGNGTMLCRVAGVATPKVVIVGAGVSGMGAAELAAGFGNQVTLLDINFHKLEEAKAKLPVNVELLFSNPRNILESIKDADVLINCILWPKWRKDHLISREMLKNMKPRALIVDVACDEAGAIETCRSTSHGEAIYIEEGITHYCVDNIPSAFSSTSTKSLCSATLPYVLKIANKGVVAALKEDRHLRNGLTCFNGILTLEETGRKQNRPYEKPENVL